MKPAVIGLTAILFASLLYVIYSQFIGSDASDPESAGHVDTAESQVNGVPESFVTLKMIMPGDNATMDVELITPIAMEEKQRFAIREGGKTVGAGVVVSITE